MAPTPSGAKLALEATASLLVRAMHECQHKPSHHYTSLATDCESVANGIGLPALAGGLWCWHACCAAAPVSLIGVQVPGAATSCTKKALEHWMVLRCRCHNSYSITISVSCRPPDTDSPTFLAVVATCLVGAADALGTPPGSLFHPNSRAQLR